MSVVIIPLMAGQFKKAYVFPPKEYMETHRKDTISLGQKMMLTFVALFSCFCKTAHLYSRLWLSLNGWCNYQAVGEQRNWRHWDDMLRCAEEAGEEVHYATDNFTPIDLSLCALLPVVAAYWFQNFVNSQILWKSRILTGLFRSFIIYPQTNLIEMLQCLDTYAVVRPAGPSLVFFRVLKWPSSLLYDGPDVHGWS